MVEGARAASNLYVFKTSLQAWVQLLRDGCTVRCGWCSFLPWEHHGGACSACQQESLHVDLGCSWQSSEVLPSVRDSLF